MREEEENKKKKQTEISHVRWQKKAVGPKASQSEEAGCDRGKVMIKTKSAVLSAL